MAYLPKSKHQIKETGGDQFVYKGTKIFYRGFYIEVSNGKYFAGNDLAKRGREQYFIHLQEMVLNMK